MINNCPICSKTLYTYNYSSLICKDHFYIYFKNTNIEEVILFIDISSITYCLSIRYYDNTTHLYKYETTEYDQLIDIKYAFKLDQISNILQCESLISKLLKLRAFS